jgi:hypothetical protein
MNDDCLHGVCGKTIADIWGTWWQVTQFIKNVSFSSIQVLFCVESLHKIPIISYFYVKMTIFLENIEFLLNNRVRVSYVTLESRQVNGIFQNYINGIYCKNWTWTIREDVFCQQLVSNLTKYLCKMNYKRKKLNRRCKQIKNPW